MTDQFCRAEQVPEGAWVTIVERRLPPLAALIVQARVAEAVQARPEEVQHGGEPSVVRWWEPVSLFDQEAFEDLRDCRLRDHVPTVSVRTR